MLSVSRYAGVQSAKDVCFYGCAALVPSTGDDIVIKVAVRLASAGGLKDCFCSVDDRMETLFGYIRLNRPELVEGEFLRCHLFYCSP